MLGIKRRDAVSTLILFHQEHSLGLGLAWAAEAVEIYSAGNSLFVHVSAVPDHTVDSSIHICIYQALDQLSFDIVDVKPYFRVFS
jgi:hypothetical protein